MNNTILVISVFYAITLICVGFLVKEIKRLKNYKNKMFDNYSKVNENWSNSIYEVILRGNKILELVNSMNILKNQNVRYSKICRRLYEENKSLNSYNKQLIETWNNNIKEKLYFSVEIEELKLKIIELESKKLKEKKGKKL